MYVIVNCNDIKRNAYKKQNNGKIYRYILFTNHPKIFSKIISHNYICGYIGANFGGGGETCLFSPC